MSLSNAPPAAARRCAPMTSDAADPARRTWLRWAGAAGGAAGVATAIPFVSTLAPSERARALGAAVEVDVADLAEGETRTVEWRGKPVWIVRRSPAMLAAVQKPDARLADPQSRRDQQPEAARNATRSLRPEVFVAVGLCTHLGCSPSAQAAGSANPSVPHDWPGGWFCPCHGSLFDGAGRVFRDMPAPTNLEVPPHRWVGATRLLIGEGDSA
jgi:ubiquinol-cytochrome c reductase iron-sulfur subunit